MVKLNGTFWFVIQMKNCTKCYILSVSKQSLFVKLLKKITNLFSFFAFNFGFDCDDFHFRLRQRTSRIFAWEDNVVFAAFGAADLHLVSFVFSSLDSTQFRYNFVRFSGRNFLFVVVDERFELWNMVVVWVSLKKPKKLFWSYISLSRDFELPLDHKKFFKFYCGYAFGLTFLFVAFFRLSVYYIPFILRNALPFLLIVSFSIIAVFDISFIIFTSLKINKMSKSGSYESSSRFKAEKERFVVIRVTNCHYDVIWFWYLMFDVSTDDMNQILRVNLYFWYYFKNFTNKVKLSFCRFWNYLAIHGILLITFLLEILSFDSSEISFSIFLIADITKCFSAFLIFAVLVVKNDMKSFLTKSSDSTEEAFENISFENNWNWMIFFSIFRALLYDSKKLPVKNAVLQ